MFRPIPPVFLTCAHCDSESQRSCLQCNGKGGYYANVFTGHPIYCRPAPTHFQIDENRFARVIFGMTAVFILLCILGVVFIK